MGKRKIEKTESEAHPKTYTLKQLFNVYGVNVIERDDINSEKFEEDIRKIDPDLFISVASPIIFKERLINIPSKGCTNIHNAPLPKYRGMLPNFWQLFYGEKESGITIHRINSGIDTGDIVMQKLCPIIAAESLHELILRTKKIGPNLLIDVIEKYRNNDVRYQESSGIESYCSFPTKKDVTEFKKRGHRIM